MDKNGIQYKITTCLHLVSEKEGQNSGDIYNFEHMQIGLFNVFKSCAYVTCSISSAASKIV